MTVVIGKLLQNSLKIFFATVEERNGQMNSRKEYNFRDYLTHKTYKIFLFRQIDNTAIIRIIKNMNISQSKGHDGISSELIKLINNDISRCITLIINQSLTSGIFPDRFKIATVTPIYKKGCKKLSLITDPFLSCQ